MKTLKTILIAGAIIIFVYTITGGVKKIEKLECSTWNNQSQEYPNFVWADWQIEQCDKYNAGLIQQGQGEEIEGKGDKDNIKQDEGAKNAFKSEIKATITAYNSEVEQTDDDPFIMASGKRVFDGAIANNCLPFGTEVAIRQTTINGVDIYRVFEVQDRMNSRYGCDNFDIWMKEKSAAIKFGVQRLTIEIL